MQRLLNHASWQANAAMGTVRDFVMERLAVPDGTGPHGVNAVAVLDETGQEKKGDHTAGVKPQYVGCAGLRHHGLIERLPGTHRYHVTDIGLTDALFLTRTHDRILRTGLAETTDPACPSRLRTADRAYRAAIDNLINRSGLAA
jgi:hypothetical protein